MLSSHIRHSPLQQHECLMAPWPPARCPGRLLHRTAPQRSGRPLFGALVCLILVVGTSHADWVYVGPKAFTRPCPTHTGGDLEYAGHGPNVWAQAILQPGSNPQGGASQALYLTLRMDQGETRSDWSRASLYRSFWLYSPPPGYQITLIWNSSSEISYTDTDHALDVFFPADTLVEEYAIMGDTSGNDIGNCTADDAYLSVYTDAIWVWIAPLPVVFQ